MNTKIPYLAILVIAVIIISGCTSLDSANKAIKTCEEKSKDLVPLKLSLYRLPDENTWRFDKNINTWNDGTAIQTSVLFWSSGSKEGQNVNYLYCDDMNGLAGDFCKSPLSYSKQVIGSDGTIIGTRAFSLNGALKPISGSQVEKKTQFGVTEIFQDFEILQQTIQGCNWVDGTDLSQQQIENRRNSDRLSIQLLPIQPIITPENFVNKDVKLSGRLIASTVQPSSTINNLEYFRYYISRDEGYKLPVYNFLETNLAGNNVSVEGKIEQVKLCNCQDGNIYFGLYTSQSFSCSEMIVTADNQRPCTEANKSGYILRASSVKMA